MSRYTRQDDFGARDLLPSGDANKVIYGADVDAEFDAIATAVNTKAGLTTSVATLKTDTSLESGDVVVTSGYTTANDGGSAVYVIQTSAEYGGTPDGYGDHTMTSGNVAVLQGGEKNAKQFGATGDGSTDDAVAFQAALNGAANLYVPAGTYILETAVEVPSNCTVRGAGYNDTILKRKTGVTDTLNTLEIHDATNVVVQDIQVDGNSPGSVVSGSGPRGTCVSIMNSDYVVCERVFAKNGSLHCFDITSPAWNTVQFDYTYQADGSTYVTLRDCIATNAGDDNITTHYSTNILIDGCYSYDSGGTHVSTNSNAFEADDGSRNVTFSNCFAKNCIRGFEVKGHDYAPSASEVNISNCQVEDCVVGVGIRHIGHYSSTAPESPTAFRVNINNVVIKNPADSTGFTGSPSVNTKGLQLWTYQHVNVSNVTIVDTDGSGGEVANDDGVIHITHRARAVNLTNIAIEGFTSAQSGVWIENQSGDINTGSINLTNCYVDGANEYLYFMDGDLDDLSLTNIGGDNATVGVKLSKATPDDYPIVWTGSQFGDSVTYPVEVGTSTPDQYDSAYDWMDRNQINRLAFGETKAGELDSDGGFDAVGSFHRVDSNGGTGNDVLEYIGAGFPGQIIVLRAEDTNRTITVRDATNGSVAHPTPNLTLAGQADFAMNTLNDTMVLIYDDGQDEWLEISRSNN